MEDGKSEALKSWMLGVVGMLPKTSAAKEWKITAIQLLPSLEKENKKQSTSSSHHKCFDSQKKIWQEYPNPKAEKRPQIQNHTTSFRKRRWHRDKRKPNKETPKQKPPPSLLPYYFPPQSLFLKKQNHTKKRWKGKKLKNQTCVVALSPLSLHRRSQIQEYKKTKKASLQLISKVDKRLTYDTTNKLMPPASQPARKRKIV
jgi:hypothetical protein